MLYQQIKQYIDYGLMVVVKNHTGLYIVFIHAQSDRLVGFGGNEKGALLSLPDHWGKEELEVYETDYGWRIHSLLPRPITPYPRGMKVMVDKSYNGGYHLRQDVYSIKRVLYNDKCSLQYELNNLAKIDHRFLIPVLEEEKTCVCEPGSLCKAHGENTTKDSWLELGRKN